MTVRIIHVGLGGWGGNWARTVVPSVPSVDVVGIVDPHGPTLESVAADIGVAADVSFGSLGDALAAVDADAVVITSPVATHVPLALTALEAGKHVLVEKPLANTVEEARTAAARAEELGLILQVSQNYRNYPAPRTVRNLLANGVLGELTAINIDFRKWDNDAPKETHRHYAFPHPLINDMAIHHFDLLRMITGHEAVSVFAKVGDPSFSKYDEEASAVITIEMEDGLVVSYRGSWLSRGLETAWAGEWSIQGEQGELFFTSRAGGEVEDASGDVVTIRRPGRIRAKKVPLEPADMVDRVAGLEIFARAVARGDVPESTGRENLGSLALMEAAARSAASGRVEAVQRP
ncbi:Gfo/Idh/MocA family protein [Microbacterium sp. DT81.1]|uniref:Gfo/Idh/MocA family protein n=1 Tax=Microbacterium sp. DT81.1 TaxID=3393413 RepID=UPI003CF5BF3F